MKLPTNWDCANAEDICERVSVGIVIEPSKHYTSDPSGVRAFRSANVRAGRVNDSNWVRLSPEGHASNGKSHLRSGDIVIVRTGAPGTACVVTDEFAGSNCIDLIFARPKPDLLNSHYFCVFINSEHGKRQALNMQGGLAQQHLNVGAFQKIKVPLPPLHEQRKIADILTTWDAALEKLEALIDAQERLKKALMQQLLTGRRRLKGFSEPWKRFRFSELLEPHDRYVEFDDENTYSLVSIRRRSGGVFFRQALQGCDIKTKVMKRVHAGDFLISRMQVVHGALGMVRSECDGMYASDSYDVLVSKNAAPLHMPLLDWLSRLRSFWHIAYISSHGVHIEKMTFKLSDFMHEKITIPSDIEEQRQIATILDTTDYQLNLLSAKRAAIDQQKRGLMQRLLTGKLRVQTLSSEVAQ